MLGIHIHNCYMTHDECIKIRTSAHRIIQIWPLHPVLSLEWNEKSHSQYQRLACIHPVPHQAQNILVKLFSKRQYFVFLFESLIEFISSMTAVWFGDPWRGLQVGPELTARLLIKKSFFQIRLNILINRYRIGRILTVRLLTALYIFTLYWFHSIVVTCTFACGTLDKAQCIGIKAINYENAFYTQHCIAGSLIGQDFKKINKKINVLEYFVIFMIM